VDGCTEHRHDILPELPVHPGSPDGRYKRRQPAGSGLIHILPSAAGRRQRPAVMTFRYICPQHIEYLHRDEIV